MRCSAMLFGVFAALAAASSSTPTSTNAAAAAASSAQAAMMACIDACPAGDVGCTSKCIAVPNPNASQVNATNTCVSNCPKGNGTATDDLNYSNCVASCIGENYFTTTGTPAPTSAGGGSGTTGTGTGTTTTGTGTAAGTATGSASSTNTAAATSTSKAAADALRVGSSAVGLVGFLAAFLAI